MEQRRKKRAEQKDLDGRVGTLVKGGRDPRAQDRAKNEAEALNKFIRENIIEAIITKAHCYGESLAVCRDIQKKFEMRPVSKSVFPLLLQFLFQRVDMGLWIRK